MIREGDRDEDEQNIQSTIFGVGLHVLAPSDRLRAISCSVSGIAATEEQSHHRNAKFRGAHRTSLSI